MAHLITLPEMKIQIKSNVFLAPTAQIIGAVKIGEKSSIWYSTVLRGDVMPIVIGKETNVQDGTVIHGTYKKYGTTIGDRVTVGHQCMLHGCTIGDEAFIGMQALIMDNCVVAPRSFIGAGALLTEGTETESEWLYLGRPAKKIRPLTDQEKAFLKQSAENYKFYTTWYGPDHFSDFVPPQDAKNAKAIKPSTTSSPNPQKKRGLGATAGRPMVAGAGRTVKRRR